MNSTTENRSSRLSLKLYCKHTKRSLVIGEATYSFWDIPRHRSEHIVSDTLLSTILTRFSIDVQIDLQDPIKFRVSGKITLYLKVAATITFSAGPVPTLDLKSLYSIHQMTKIVELLLGKGSEELPRLPSVWRRFIKSLDTVASNAQKMSEVCKYLSSRLTAQVDLNDNSSIYRSKSPWER